MIPRSEDDILSLLDAHFPRSGRGLLLGRGDDCALLAPAELPRALTCDVFVEDSHFRTRYFTPYELGWKALAVNVSDLASAGAEPEGFALGLTLTGRESGEWLDACFSGMADLAGRWNMALAGGIWPVQACCIFPSPHGVVWNALISGGAGPGPEM